MKVDYANRNCYNYGVFSHLVRNCRNKRMKNRIEKGRRLEYGERRIMEEGNKQSINLNGEEDLIVFD